jgi:hypothetical protein
MLQQHQQQQQQQWQITGVAVLRRKCLYANEPVLVTFLAHLAMSCKDTAHWRQ